MLTAALAVCLSLPHPAQARTVDARIGWLTERVAHHRYVCRHGHRATRVFACKALRWTKRELGEARAEKHLRDWAAPPEPYLSIARCEQHSETGLWGVRWDAYSSSYEGGYGFAHSTWRQFRLPWMAATANRATVREQTIVAQRLHAYFGDYSSWPACHIRLGLY